MQGSCALVILTSQLCILTPILIVIVHGTVIPG